MGCGDEPAHPQNEGGIWPPYLPDEIVQAFPLPSSRHYGIMSTGQLENVLETNKIPNIDNAGYGGGQYGWVPLGAEVDVGGFNPLKHGFLIRYTGQYLFITFPDVRTMHVRKLKKPEYKAKPTTVSVPALKELATFYWSVEGNPGLEIDWAPGKMRTGNSQNGYYSVTTCWEGGEEIELPLTMSRISIRAEGPGGEDIWSFRWSGDR